MSCNYPIQAYRIQSFDNKGKRYTEIRFDTKSGYDIIGYLKVPCGVCIGCKLERARQWAIRCMHEASLYDENCFITLTYNEEHLPDRNELKYSDFQLFMKRLRKKFASRKIRFFMCGEYGETFRRPHFHACLFNCRFDDMVLFKRTKAGSDIYTSEILNSLWTDSRGNSIGYATVGELNFNSAGYVARYVMKKGYGHDDSDYDQIELETGEVFKQEKEFNKMSLKPGIGTGFYHKYKSDMFPHDICVMNGVAMKPPRFYYRKLKEDNPMMHEDIASVREQRAVARAADNIRERLETKEKVLKAKLKFLNRDLI